MYMLNVLFNFNDDNGRFTGDRGSGPLLKSMNWLRLNGPEPADPVPPGFPDALPAGSIWEDLGEARTLLLPSVPDPGHICIRVAPFPAAVLPAGAMLQLVVTFGRPVKHNLPTAIASPFKDGATVQTTFVLGPISKNTSAGWFLVCGTIDPATRPTKPNLTDRYEFSMGVIVTGGGVTRYYGEDPEVDVGN